MPGVSLFLPRRTMGREGRREGRRRARGAPGATLLLRVRSAIWGLDTGIARTVLTRGEASHEGTTDEAWSAGAARRGKHDRRKKETVGAGHFGRPGGDRGGFRGGTRDDRRHRDETGGERPGGHDLRAGGHGRYDSRSRRRDVRRIRGVPPQCRRHRQRPRQEGALHPGQRHRAVGRDDHRGPGFAAGRRAVPRRAAGVDGRTQPRCLRGRPRAHRGPVGSPGHAVRRQFAVGQPAPDHPQAGTRQVRRRVQRPVRDHPGRGGQRRRRRLGEHPHLRRARGTRRRVQRQPGRLDRQHPRDVHPERGGGRPQQRRRLRPRPDRGGFDRERAQRRDRAGGLERGVLPGRAVQRRVVHQRRLGRADPAHGADPGRGRVVPRRHEPEPGPRDPQLRAGIQPGRVRTDDLDDFRPDREPRPDLRRGLSRPRGRQHHRLHALQQRRRVHHLLPVQRQRLRRHGRQQLLRPDQAVHGRDGQRAQHARVPHRHGRDQAHPLPRRRVLQRRGDHAHRGLPVRVGQPGVRGARQQLLQRQLGRRVPARQHRRTHEGHQLVRPAAAVHGVLQRLHPHGGGAGRVRRGRVRSLGGLDALPERPLLRPDLAVARRRELLLRVPLRHRAAGLRQLDAHGGRAVQQPRLQQRRHGASRDPGRLQVERRRQRDPERPQSERRPRHVPGGRQQRGDAGGHQERPPRHRRPAVRRVHQRDGHDRQGVPRLERDERRPPVRDLLRRAIDRPP